MLSHGGCVCFRIWVSDCGGPSLIIYVCRGLTFFVSVLWIWFYKVFEFIFDTLFVLDVISIRPTTMIGQYPDEKAEMHNPVGISHRALNTSIWYNKNSNEWRPANHCMEFSMLNDFAHDMAGIEQNQHQTIRILSKYGPQGPIKP